LITQAEFARRIGKQRSWVSTLVKKGKLTVVKDERGRKRLDFDRAMAEYKGSVDYNRDPQREWGKKQRGEEEEELKYGDIKCADDMIGKETQRSKLIRETYEARLKEMEYKETLGELVHIGEIEEVNNRIATSIRTLLLAMPSKIAPQLEGLSIAKIQRRLEDEINDILTELNQLGGKS